MSDDTDKLFAEGIIKAAKHAEGGSANFSHIREASGEPTPQEYHILILDNDQKVIEASYVEEFKRRNPQAKVIVTVEKTTPGGDEQLNAQKPVAPRIFWLLAPDVDEKQEWTVVEKLPSGFAPCWADIEVVERSALTAAEARIAELERLKKRMSAVRCGECGNVAMWNSGTSILDENVKLIERIAELETKLSLAEQDRDSWKATHRYTSLAANGRFKALEAEIAELNGAREFWAADISTMKDELYKAAARNLELVEALEWYAKTKFNGDDDSDPTNRVGHFARVALAKHKRETGGESK